MVWARKDLEKRQAIETLTADCNACHQAERMPYIHVAPSDIRRSGAT
jgi:hypothetical protein